MFWNKGFYKHQTFGLREEWLALWFEKPESWPEEGGLGPRQVEPLRVWLKTAGLVDRHGQKTFLARRFEQKGLTDLAAWEILWTNVVFNFATAHWYVLRMGLGRWTTSELHQRLRADFPHCAPRTLRNGLTELVGLLERTPVGKNLHQGEVTRQGRVRVVHRRPYPFVSLEAAIWSTQRLFKEHQRTHFSLNEEVLFPWTIFGAHVKEFYLELLGQGEPPFIVEKDHTTGHFWPPS